MFSMLYNYCKDVAEAETRTIFVIGAQKDCDLPPGAYSFIEMFCDEKNCDCRRCLFMVQANWSSETLAFIGYGWEKPEFYTRWMGDDEATDMLVGVHLEPMQPQSKYAKEILKLFKKSLLSDEKYLKRVQRHYQLMQDVVNGKTPKNSKKQKKTGKKTKDDTFSSLDNLLSSAFASSMDQKDGVENRIDPDDLFTFILEANPFELKSSASTNYDPSTEKISQAFIHYLQPFIDTLGDGSRESIDEIFNIGVMVWNAYISDTVEGKKTHTQKLRKRYKDKILLKFLIDRKKNEFGNDLRLIQSYKNRPDGKGGYILSVEAVDYQPFVDLKQK